MHEPVSNADNDDVVASVRRLVTREQADGVPPRLLLTAALRVPEERDEALAAERAAAAPAQATRMAGDGAAMRDREAERAGEEAPAPPLTPLLLRDRVDAPPAPEAALPIDPQALRGLVAEVVREELHGVMGERVTRNLRKLVRGEVARAIASREAGSRER